MSKTKQRTASAYAMGKQDAKQGKTMNPPKKLSQAYIAGYKKTIYGTTY